jgi:hypothetical protein
VLSGDANGDDGPNFSNRGDNSEHVVTATNVSLTLDGFTITGGNASQYGGGLYFGWVRTGAAVVSVRVRDCLFADNQAGSHGGAVCALREWTLLSLELTRCRFLGNRSSAEAGALFYRKDARLVAEDCVFQDNESPDGGAVREYLGDATFRRCSFLGNRSTGGGGAVSLVSGSHTFEECFFATNACGGEGGGLRVCGYPDAAVSAVLRNCVFAGNTAALCGGALAHAFDGQPTTLNAWNGTLYGNAAPAGGGTVWSDSRATVSLANFIIWGNTGGAIVGGAPAVTYSDVQGGYGGTGNLDADPVFLNPADVLGVDRKAGTGDDGLRIPAGSPCADTGTASGAPFIDIIGTTRPYGPGTDMGAYEYDPSVRGPELPGGAVLKIR